MDLIILAHRLSVMNVDPNKTDLMKFAEEGDINRLRCLLSEDPSQIDLIDSSGKTALMYAAQRGQHDTFMYLLEIGAKISNMDETGNTALFYALSKGDEKMCREILSASNGNMPQNKNSEGNTVLHIAVRRGFYDLACFIAEGLPIEIILLQDASGHTISQIGVGENNSDRDRFFQFLKPRV